MNDTESQLTICAAFLQVKNQRQKLVSYVISVFQQIVRKKQKTGVVEMFLYQLKGNKIIFLSIFQIG